jgi:hypothetical protein
MLSLESYQIRFEHIAGIHAPLGNSDVHMTSFFKVA